jgi:HEAT repeat protein
LLAVCGLLLPACARVSTPKSRPDRRVVSFETERTKACVKELAALKSRHDPLAAEFLLAGLTDRSAQVRICALELIAPTPDSLAVSRITTLLYDPVQEVRLAAVISLKLSASLARASLLPFIDLLSDADPDVVAAAEYTLGSSPDSLVSHRLALRLQNPREPAPVRASCARVLEQLHDPKTLPALRANLGELNDTVRVAVLHALPAFGESIAAPLLLGALDGQRPATRIAAAQGLGRLAHRRMPLGLPKVTARLVSLLSDRNSDVALAAVRALGMTRDSAAAEPLTRFIRKLGTAPRENANPKPEVLSPNPDLELSVSSLGLPSKGVPEVSVIRALARIGDPALRAVETLLQDDRPELREAGISVLDLIGSSRAVSRLADALPDWECGTRAAEALDHWHWKPQNDAQLIHYLIARRDNYGLFVKTALAGPVLKSDLESGDRRQVENAAITSVALGVTEVVPRLIEVLGQQGSEILASAYVNSGLDTLARAGRDWAAHHGYVLIKGDDTTGVRWAGWR